MGIKLLLLKEEEFIYIYILFLGLLAARVWIQSKDATYRTVHIPKGVQRPFIEKKKYISFRYPHFILVSPSLVSNTNDTEMTAIEK